MERIQARRGAGNPIPDALRKALALELNHDLNAVRIHDDAEADTLAKKVNAVAFTTGQDIFFKAGTFNPNTRTGVELIAHEVTHTVQQAQGKAKPGIDGDAGLETEARAMGARFARAEPAAASGLAPRNAAISGAVAIQRAPASTLTSPKVASPVDTFKKLLQAAAIRTLDANAARILGQQKTYSNTSASEPAWSELRRIAALQVRMDQRWEQLSMRLFSQSQRAGIQTFDRVTTMIQATMGGRGRLSDSADVILGDMRTHLDPLALMGFGDFDSEQAKKQFELQVEEERQRERPLAETLSLITNVEDARDALHARYPAVGILTRDTAAVGLAATPNTVQNNAQLNARVQPEMKKVQQAIAELRAKIVAGDLPVMQMDVLVQEVLGSMTSDADRKQAQAWVGSERVRNQLIDIVLILATLGLTLVSLLVPGSTLLVVAGVGMGGATAAKGLVDANKQAGVSRTQDLGGKPLSSVSKAKAEEQLFIAWANTMLAAAPVVATAAGGLLRVGRAAPLAMKAGAAGRSAQEAGAALVGERTVAEAGTARSAAKSGPVGSTGRARTAGSVDLGTAAKRTVPDAQPAPRAGPGTGGMVPAVPEMVPPPGVTRPGLSRTPPNPRNPAQERYNQSRSAARRAEYQYDPKVRSELQLQKDLKPQVRTSETPAQLQQRVDLAQRELTVRQKIAGLGTKPWRPNLVENDAQTAGHSVDRHGWQLTLPDLKDRITGVGRWTKQESYSYKWTDETTANRVIQEHIRVNWDVIRRALAETGLYEGKPFNTSSRVGEGYYNKNVTLGGPRIPVYGETSWARVRIALNSDGKPYIITTFPVGGF